MTDSTHLPPSALDDWLAETTAALSLEPGDVPVSKVLDVARDVAHGVARPAAPLTTFLLGLALGAARGDGPSADFDDLAGRVRALIDAGD